jgi:glycerophosphoryl diester phosphodiesterase
VKIYAHRGWSSDFPENTLLAFDKALESGVDGIELDVHATADGWPVVIHDRSLQRTTSGSGNIDESQLADLRSLDAGSGQRVPLLQEVLELVADRVHLDIEIKGQGIEAAVLAALSQVPSSRWAISSFAWDTLRRVRALDPRAELWPLAERCDDDLINIALALGSPAVSLYAGDYTAASAVRLRDAGLKAVVWTVNQPDEALRVRDLGAFALCTDDPALIAAALSGPVGRDH